MLAANKGQATQEAAREKERESLYSDARTMFEAKLQELMNAQDGGQKPDNPPKDANQKATPGN